MAMGKLISLILRTPSCALRTNLVAHGWDGQPQHQQRAIYAYYGGHYSADPNKYYMKAVLKYADAMGNYLKDHPLDSRPTSFPEPLTPEERETSRDQRTSKPVN